MKEKLFRGKSKETKEWVYGCLLEVCGKSYIVPKDSYWDYGELMDITEVIPETVGQFVGLYTREDHPDGDMTLAFIYEGDILESRLKRIGERGVLIVVRDIRECKNLALYVDNYEIIGNIHDNPELVD